MTSSALLAEPGGGTPTEVSTLALVESPEQLLDVIELAHGQGDAVRGDGVQGDGLPGGEGLGELRIVVLAPSHGRGREQLRAVVTLARQEGFDVGWHEPRSGGASVARTVRSLLSDLGPTCRLVVGVPFSGVPQVLVSLVRPTHLTVVDDGTATAELLQHVAGLQLRRPDGPVTALRVLTPAPPGAVGPAPVGVEVRHNERAWLRARWPRPEVRDGVDLVGAGRTGWGRRGFGDADAGTHLAAVRQVVAEQGVTRYLAGGGETETELTDVGRLGVDVVRPVLPLELELRRGPVSATVLVPPSRSVHTLRVALAGTRVRVLGCGVPDPWTRPLC